MNFIDIMAPFMGCVALRNTCIDGICSLIFLFRQKERGRLKRRWVDNIKMILREIGWCSMDWIGLAQDRDKLSLILNTVMNLRVP